MQDKSGSNSPVLLPSSGVRLLVVTGPRGGVEAGTTTTGRQLLNSRSTHCNPFPLILNGRRPLLKVSYYWGYCLSLLSLFEGSCSCSGSCSYPGFCSCSSSCSCSYSCSCFCSCSYSCSCPCLLLLLALALPAALASDPTTCKLGFNAQR